VLRKRRGFGFRAAEAGLAPLVAARADRVGDAVASSGATVATDRGVWTRGSTIAGRKVYVGNLGMIAQSEHIRGSPCLVDTPDFGLIVVTDDPAWAEDAISQLPKLWHRGRQEVRDCNDRSTGSAGPPAGRRLDLSGVHLPIVRSRHDTVSGTPALPPAAQPPGSYRCAES
jgi:hypothetical protein